jgi:galactose mutarotase-like enzyme
VGPSRFTACIEKGCRLMEWDIEMAKGAVRKVLYWPEGADWADPSKIRGGNPILFPFVARTFEGSNENLWKAPDGQVLPMPRHGFARNATFEAVEISPQGFKAKLEKSPDFNAYYPFQYDFFVQYDFDFLELKANFELVNRDTVPIPWCAGHHFYFTLPWHEGLSHKDYRIDMEAKKCFYHGTDGSLKKAERPQAYVPLSDPSWVDRLHTHLKSPIATIKSSGGEEGFRVIFEKLLPWSTLTTWTTDPNAPFYCIEPWMGLPNATSHECGLHWVAPHTSERFEIRISLE